jgi:hypothetical protein
MEFIWAVSKLASPITRRGYPSEVSVFHNESLFVCMKSALPTGTVDPLFFFLAKAFHGVLRRVTHKEMSLFRSIVTMLMEMNVSFSASAVKIKA